MDTAKAANLYVIHLPKVHVDLIRPQVHCLQRLGLIRLHKCTRGQRLADK